MTTEIPYKGHVIAIEEDGTYDDEYANPRNNCPMTQMVCFHTRYNLGDTLPYDKNHFSDWGGLESRLKKDGAVIVLPLYLMDHGSQSISTTPFSCHWDSGQLGFVYITAEKIRQEYNVKRVTKSLKEKALDRLKYEVDQYDKFISGDIWRYNIDPGKDLDEDFSNEGNFLGSEDALSRAKEEVDMLVLKEQELKLAASMPKEEIPLNINRDWKYQESRDIFKRRLKAYEPEEEECHS